MHVNRITIVKVNLDSGSTTQYSKTSELPAASTGNFTYNLLSLVSCVTLGTTQLTLGMSE